LNIYLGKRTLHNAFKGRDRAWDPYGVAKVDMSEMLLGHKYLHIKVPVHNCMTPDILGYSETNDGKLLGFNGAVDGPGIYSLYFPFFLKKIGDF